MRRPAQHRALTSVFTCKEYIRQFLIAPIFQMQQKENETMLLSLLQALARFGGAMRSRPLQPVATETSMPKVKSRFI